MNREVKHDGANALEVRFPFDRRLVELMKSLPNRRWQAPERYWRVPADDVVLVVDLLERERFRFCTSTLRLYRELGGSRALRETGELGASHELADSRALGADREPVSRDDREPPPPPPRLRGLFDESVPADEPLLDERIGGPGQGLEDLTVSTLNERVRAVLFDAFPAPVWVVGELSGWDRQSHRRVVGFSLVERDDGGAEVSKLPAVLFPEDRLAIELALDRAGNPFRLEDEVTVRVLGHVDLYVPWGAYRLVVHALDVRYTLGEAARRREEIVRQLAAEGLLERNSRLPFPALPLRVGLVTSLGSDAHADVLRTLEESGFAFRVTAHGARVQGPLTERSVLHALATLETLACELDVVLICRGGGARTDLTWLDTAALGRAVALFPLPVVVGIGHEQDLSVLDHVARRAKTPTAAAALLVESVRTALVRVEDLGQSVLARAARRVELCRRALDDRAVRMGLATRGLLGGGRSALEHRRARLARASRQRLQAEATRLARLGTDLPRAARALLDGRRSALESTARAIGHGARRDVASAARRMRALAAELAPRARRRLGRESERVVLRERRVQLVDPRRVVERGYAILRHEGGRVLCRASDAAAGVRLEAELAEGALRLRSEGPLATGLQEDERRDG
jgi:exodeoxyribonuclease VII large subunit